MRLRPRELRLHVGAMPLIAGLEYGLELWNGLYGTDYGIFV